MNATAWACEKFDRFLRIYNAHRPQATCTAGQRQRSGQDTIKTSATTKADRVLQGQHGICQRDGPCCCWCYVEKPNKDTSIINNRGRRRAPRACGRVKLTNVTPEDGRVVLHDDRCYSSVNYHPHVDWMTKLRKGVSESLKALFNVRSLLSVSNGLLI